MAIVKLPGSKCFDTKMEVHTSKQKTDTSLAQEHKKHLSNESHKHGIIDNGKQKKVKKKSGK